MKYSHRLVATAVGVALGVIVTVSSAWSAPLLVTLCHKGKQTLTLPAPAAKQHVAQHGDTLGPCGGCGLCVSDAECPDGRTCNADEICLPSCECPVCDVCTGFCVR